MANQGLIFGGVLFLIVCVTLFLLLTSRVCSDKTKPKFTFSKFKCTECPADKPSWNQTKRKCEAVPDTSGGSDAPADPAPAAPDTSGGSDAPADPAPAAPGDKYMKNFENTQGPNTTGFVNSVLSDKDGYLYDYNDDKKTFKMASIEDAKEICLQKDECKSISCTKDPGYCFYYGTAPEGVSSDNHTYYVKTQQ